MGADRPASRNLACSGNLLQRAFWNTQDPCKQTRSSVGPGSRHELKERYIRSTDHSSSALVFATREGAPLAADNLRKKSLRTACKRAGLQRIDWHALRHTHGTLLHAQGTPLKVAQAQLGHSHMATTLEVYTHTSGSAQRDAVNMLADQLFPNVPKLDGSGNTAQEETQVIQ